MRRKLDSLVMLRFNFVLRPVGEIAPWTAGDGTDPNLLWFGLSDGHYWISVDEVDLFRFSESRCNEWRLQGFDVSEYADYYIVRLWEDVLGSLAEFLEPVPVDLRSFVGGQMREWDEVDSSAADVARSWWAQHSLDNGHIMAPDIRWWREKDDGMDVVWTEWSHPRAEDWAARPHGGVAVSTEDFVAAVTDFNRVCISRSAGTRATTKRRNRARRHVESGDRRHGRDVGHPDHRVRPSPIRRIRWPRNQLVPDRLLTTQNEPRALLHHRDRS